MDLEPDKPISDKHRLRLQVQGLRSLKKQSEPKFTNTWFPYTSGEVGPYYIQSIAIENDGWNYHDAIVSMCELIRGTINLHDFDAISGGESRDWDFSNPVAVQLHTPHTKIYKDGKAKGATVIEGMKYIHVADLNNEGSSMRDLWVPAIKAKRAEIIHAYFYVDRMEDGVNVLEELGIQSDSVVPFDANAWQFLLDEKYISPEIYRSLNERMENKKAWAHNALRTHISQLEDMLRNSDPKEVAKAEKILKVGYPEIKDELLDLMKGRGYEHEFGGEK